jgi:hypothetical protein
MARTSNGRQSRAKVKLGKGIEFNAIPTLAATLIFQDATAGILTFRSQGNQVGSGLFTYSSEPIAGTFLFEPFRFLFIPALNPIPEVTVPGITQ